MLSRLATLILCVVDALYYPSTGSECAYSNDPMADCNGAMFVETDGIPQKCFTHTDCYDMREPPMWCARAPNHEWTETGCHCDDKLRSCIINRIILTRDVRYLEYSFCYPTDLWYCK